MNKSKITVLTVTAVCAVGIILAAMTVYGFATGGGCFILRITGVPCPTCGITRAILCLITGRFSKAFEYHPLFFMPFVMAGLAFLAILNKKWQKPLLCALVILLIAFLAVWLIRITLFDLRG